MMISRARVGDGRTFQATKVPPRGHRPSADQSFYNHPQHALRANMETRSDQSTVLSVLTYYPTNTKVKNIPIRNFHLLQNASETRDVFRPDSPYLVHLP